jgi:hypothetical protein
MDAMQMPAAEFSIARGSAVAAFIAAILRRLAGFDVDEPGTVFFSCPPSASRSFEYSEDLN